MTKHYDSRLVAAALAFKLNARCKALQEQTTRTEGEHREMVRLRAAALVLRDRSATERARKLGQRW